MTKKSLLDSIDVPAPCPQSWDTMVGGDKSRYCGNCEKDIYNLSELSRGEIKKLLFQSKESVCIRMEKDADGRIKTLKKQFHQITRQMPIAAGILSASLTLSAATQAQNKVENNQTDKTDVSKSVEDAKSNASIRGTITDSYGAAIPDSEIVLFDSKNKATRKTKSNDEGFYEFKNVEASVYDLKVEAPYFRKFVRQNFTVKDNENSVLSVSLELENYTETVGLFAETTQITEPTEAKISDKVQMRQIETLPLNRNKMILGLFKADPPRLPNQMTGQNQHTSRISFTIYDQLGSVISQAKVKLTDQKTKKELSVVADKEGVARFEGLPRGDYEVEISSLGFRTYRQNIQITQPIEPNLKITLEAGMIGEFIVVRSEIPLFQAVEQNDNEMVKRIIKSGFNIHTKDEKKETVLHVAVQHGNLEIVRFLLDKGAKVNVKDKSKRTPLAMLFDSFEDNEKINHEIIRLFVSKGANVNVRDEDSQTFLMKACEDDNLESVKLLLELGANPNLKDKDGEAAADKTDSEEIKSLLTAHGAIR